MTKPDLSVEIGPLRLKNPVLTASGTCGYGEEYAPYLELARLGGFTTKSVTRRPRKGNPPERIVETPSGMLNAIGLANVGLDVFMKDKLPVAARLATPVFVNVAGSRIEDYVAVCETIDATGALAGIELNVSCPNVRDGLTFGTDAGLLKELVSAVRPVVRKGVLIVKLSPNVTDITETARAAIEGGADALSLINTYLGMALNIDTRRPALAHVSGGLSGPAIRPLAVYLVHRVYTELARDAGVPLIGMGGIATWRDAVEFILAGATAVSIGTALFIEPDAPIRIIEGIEGYLVEHGLASVHDLIGAVERS
ncbi:MAG: dihydroorotate dehydrogenase [Phycisphaerae bacterium]